MQIFHNLENVVIRSILAKLCPLLRPTAPQVVPTENNGFAEMVKLARSGPYPLWFTFQKLKYVWDSDKKVGTCQWKKG